MERINKTSISKELFLRKTEIFKKIKKLDQLFSPEIVKMMNWLSQIEESDTETLQKIASAIEKNPALTLNVLKIANSPFYGLSRRISNVYDALLFLGLKTLKLIIYVNFSSQIIKKENPEIFSHMVWVSLCAKNLAQALEINTVSEITTIGLIHDFGKIVQKMLSKKKWETLLSIHDTTSKNSTPDSLNLEKFLFGTDHAEIGAYIMKTWHFPEILVEAVENHHSPQHSVRYPLETTLIYLADTIFYFQKSAENVEKLLEDLEKKFSENLKKIEKTEKTSKTSILTVVKDFIEKKKITEIETMIDLALHAF